MAADQVDILHTPTHILRLRCKSIDQRFILPWTFLAELVSVYIPSQLTWKPYLLFYASYILFLPSNECIPNTILHSDCVLVSTRSSSAFPSSWQCASSQKIISQYQFFSFSSKAYKPAHSLAVSVLNLQQNPVNTVKA